MPTQTEEPRLFQFQLRDNIVRGMNRQQYKEASRWMRLCNRICNRMLNPDAIGRHIAAAALCGYSEIKMGDLIKL